MQLFMLQLFIIAAAVATIIGSSHAAIATLPNAQEFATSTATLTNVDSLLAFPQEIEIKSGNSNSNSNSNYSPSFSNLNGK